MSYILDSIKKSDQERGGADTAASVVMRSPPFLENEKKQGNNKWLIILIVIAICMAVTYFLFYILNLDPNIFKTTEYKVKEEAVQRSVSNAPGVDIKAREEAVLLYKQALSKKSKPEVDSLYQELEEKKLENQSGTAQESPPDTLEKLSKPELQATIPADAPVDKLSVIVKDSTPKAEKEPAIPSIYELDVIIRRSIPSVDYGAHIYATDNNSGFVILDGARRRVGDKLDSGLFVEKIEEESVVLSYNGTLFSLPAMKSWQGK